MPPKPYDAARARSRYALPIWVDSLVLDTPDLDAAEFGVWHFLIYAMWRRRELYLPDDDRKLSRIARMSKTIWVNRLRPVMVPLFDIQDGRWSNHRLSEEASKTEAFLYRQHLRALGAEAPPPAVADLFPDLPSDSTYRERLLSVAGVDPVSGLTGHGSAELGTKAQMIEAERWRNDLGLSEEDVFEVIRSTMARHRGPPPQTLAYFTPIMERAAGEVQRARKKPMEVQDAPEKTASGPGPKRGRASGSGLASIVARRQGGD